MEEKEYNPYKSLYVPNEELWERVKEKSQRPDISRSISQITCRLFEMWLSGDVMPYPENNMDKVL